MDNRHEEMTNEVDLEEMLMAEFDRLMEVLISNGGNKSSISRYMGISRSKLTMGQLRGWGLEKWLRLLSFVCQLHPGAFEMVWRLLGCLIVDMARDFDEKLVAKRKKRFFNRKKGADE